MTIFKDILAYLFLTMTVPFHILSQNIQNNHHIYRLATMMKLRLILLVLVILAIAFSLLFFINLLDRERVTFGHFEKGPFDWLLPDDPATAQNFLGSVAEVVCGILAITITVVAIIVQLAANRYISKIIDIFVNDRTNVIILCFFIITAVYGLWMTNSIEVPQGSPGSEDFFPRMGISIYLLMTSVSFFLLVPYFYYVFNFLKPLNIINRIKIQAGSYWNRAIQINNGSSRDTEYYTNLQDSLVAHIEQLSEIAMSSVNSADKSQGLFCVQSLREILTGEDTDGKRRMSSKGYMSAKRHLPAQWFEIGKEHFLAFNEDIVRNIWLMKYWVEMKILLEFTTLLTHALKKDQKLINAIAIRTREIAIAALKGPDMTIVRLSRDAFNAYLKNGIDKRDVLSTTDILHHYRLLGEKVLEKREDTHTLMEIAKSIIEYGRLAYKAGMPRVLETVAYDLRKLNEVAYTHYKSQPNNKLDEQFIFTLLDILLTVDDFPKRSDAKTLLGVRASQAILASFYMLEKFEEPNKTLIQKIQNDMKDEPLERLADLKEKILDCDTEWESVIDANRPNERYTPIGIQYQLIAFFKRLGV